MAASSAQVWSGVQRIAGAQHGRIHVSQLRECGLRRGGIDAAVASRRLIREHVGVYAVGHQGGGRHGRWMSAVLAGGDGALLSFRSAATLHGLRDGEGPRPDVTVPTRNGRSRPAIAIHRMPLEAEDADLVDGIPTTSVARTIADLAQRLDEAEVRRAVREAQYLRVFDLAAFERAAARAPRRALTAVLQDLRPATTDLEDAFLVLLDRHGIPRPLSQVTLLAHRVDFLWPEARLVVELDGARAHTTADAFQRDRAQTNALQLAGYLVLRFTHADVRRRPARVAALVREALGRRMQA